MELGEPELSQLAERASRRRGQTVETQIGRTDRAKLAPQQLMHVRIVAANRQFAVPRQQRAVARDLRQEAGLNFGRQVELFRSPRHTRQAEYEVNPSIIELRGHGALPGKGHTPSL